VVTNAQSFTARLRKHTRGLFYDILDLSWSEAFGTEKPESALEKKRLFLALDTSKKNRKIFTYV